MKLKELNPEALEEFFGKNQTIRSRVYERLEEDATEEINFYLKGFTVNNYEISSFSYSFIKVEEENYQQFIKDCIEFYKETMFGSEELFDKLERMAKHVWKYTDAYYDMSYDNWYNFSTWIESGINDAAEQLATWLSGFYDIDDCFAFDEFLNLVECDYFDNIDINPDTLEATETVTKKIA